MAVFPAPEGPEMNMAVLSPIPSLSLSSESPSLIWKSESLSASHHSSVWLLVWLLDALLFCFAKSLEKQKTVQYSASSYNIVVILTNMVPTIFPPNWCCIDVVLIVVILKPTSSSSCYLWAEIENDEGKNKVYHHHHHQKTKWILILVLYQFFFVCFFSLPNLIT